MTLIRKADLENHNKDGGFWTVIDGKVYDIKDFQTQSLTGNSVLGEIQQPYLRFYLYLYLNIKYILLNTIGINSYFGTIAFFL